MQTFFNALSTMIMEQPCKDLSQGKGNRLMLYLVSYLAQECLQSLFIVSELAVPKESFCIVPSCPKQVTKAH